MIIKFAGIIMILASSAFIGFGFAECMASREREFANLSDAVDMMLSEIAYGTVAVRDAAALVTPRVNGIAGEMMEIMCTIMDSGERVSDAWTEAVIRKAYAMSFKKSDRDILVKSSYLFEEYELEKQKKSLERLRDKLTDMCNDAGKEKRKNAKIARMLGIYGGALICLIIL